MLINGVPKLSTILDFFLEHDGRKAKKKRLFFLSAKPSTSLTQNPAKSKKMILKSRICTIQSILSPLAIATVCSLEKRSAIQFHPWNERLFRARDSKP